MFCNIARSFAIELPLGDPFLNGLFPRKLLLAYELVLHYFVIGFSVNRKIAMNIADWIYWRGVPKRT
jgi:hypothetical protein